MKMGIVVELNSLIRFRSTRYMENTLLCWVSAATQTVWNISINTLPKMSMTKCHCIACRPLI